MMYSAILGAAAGSGIALVLGLSLVFCKYYFKKRKLEEWSALESKQNASPLNPQKSEKFYYSLENFEINIVKEKLSSQNADNISPPTINTKTPSDNSINSVIVPPLQHQSKSYPGGHPSLCRTPSVSSQSSIDSTPSKGHRGSSPQIRTFAPDGRSVLQDSTHSLSPKRNPSRSPSPLRAASLDIRSSSPSFLAEIRTSSPSQASLSSLASVGSASVPISPKTGNSSVARCLSPLLIPSRTHTPDNTIPLPPASPLGAIQPDLYTRKDGPMIIPKNPENGPDLGRLHYRLKYDFDRSDLIIHLIEAHDLLTFEEGSVNPFVRVSLEPEIDLRKRQTIIHNNNNNPYFDQNFKFPISHEDLQSKSLILQIYDFNKYSKNCIIGEVRMGLEDFDVTSNSEIWGEISKISNAPEDAQELLVSLSYLPSAERLTVIILKARNLYQAPGKECIDPFVKVYLIVNGKRVKKKKTAVKKCCNPSWNEAFNFTLSSTNLSNSAIEICVMDQSNDLMGSNPLLGCCVIGPKESGPERDHWMEITKCPRNAFSNWHILR